MPTRNVDRTPPSPIAPAGSLLAGAAEVDVTPPFGLPLAGYSTLAQVGHGVSGRLFARALVLQDRRGERVALCFVDLMGASRYLLEKAAARTAASCGIGPSRLVLAGTHTHTAPAWFYGNSVYDTFASREAGFDPGFADFVAGGIATAVEGAAAALRPARVGVSVRAVWGMSRNRSRAAFERNPEAAGWNSAPRPGAGAPADLLADQRAVDPRLTALAAFEAASGDPIAVFGTFGCHATAIGHLAPYYSPDWPGYAVRAARAELESASPGAKVVAAVAPSAAGDVNALRYSLTPKVDPGPALAAWVGDRLGHELAQAGRAAAGASSDAAEIDVRYAEPLVSHGGDLGAGLALARRWYFGAPTLGGSEESRSLLHELGLTREGMTGDDFPADDPQHPKTRGLGLVQDLLQQLLDLVPCPVFPLHTVRIGPHLFATVPGEPTTVAAHRIELDLLAATGAAGATVIGYSGDYGGYFTTREEYDAQHYEGSSMLFGRNTAAHIAARLVRIATGQESADTSSGRIVFETGPERSQFRPGDDCPGGIAPSPEVERAGRFVEVRWRMARGSRVAFDGRWLVRLEARSNGSWQPVRHQGRDFDDVSQPILVHRVPAEGPLALLPPDLAGGEGSDLWFASFHLPADPGPAPLRVTVAPRDRFPGFEIAVPA